MSVNPRGGSCQDPDDDVAMSEFEGPLSERDQGEEVKIVAVATRTVEDVQVRIKSPLNSGMFI